MEEIAPNRIYDVLGSTVCSKHMAGRTSPCWYIHTVAGKMLPAICNKRAKRAGFSNQINPQSMRKKARF